MSVTVSARARELRLAVAGGWVAAVAATQAWPSWEAQIRDRFATDVVTYEAIARAAPGLPQARFPEQRAQRFPLHWAIGSVSDLTGTGLHALYRVAVVLLLLATVVAMHRAFTSLELGLGAYALCMGVLVASAFPVRYGLAAPGMLSDSMFVLGLAIVLLGFVEDRNALMIAGAAIGELGRQSAVAVAIVAAAALLLRHERRATGAAVLTLAAVAAIYVAEWAVARRFEVPLRGGISGYTILGSLDHPLRFLTRGSFARPDARAFVGLLVPLALIAAGMLRGVRPRALPMLLAAVVIIQPFLLAPHVVGNNATRLVALAIPALTITAAYQLRAASLHGPSLWIAAVAIFCASLYPRYSRLGVPSPAAWAAIEVAAAACILLASSRWSLRPQARPFSAS